MPDISMCANEFCPSKESCYRFRAIPNIGRQAYACNTVDPGEKKCDSYWPCENGDMVIKDGLPARYYKEIAILGGGRRSGLSHAIEMARNKAAEVVVTGHKCKYVRREGEGCRANNNCKYPNCDD